MTTTTDFQTSDNQTQTVQPDSEAPRPEKPAALPKKFWDPEAGTIRLEALIKSYGELEKRFTRIQAKTGEDGDGDEPSRESLQRALGWPEDPEDYDLKLDHTCLTCDPELNTHLHQLGFTKAQAQAVYDLAAERLVPMILDVLSDLQAERELQEVTQNFGGPEKWPEVARQLLAFGQKTLPPETLRHLAGSATGVKVLHQLMMQHRGAVLPTGLGQATDDPGLDRLQSLMRDPRYWRDHDPKFVEKVTQGFERIYG